MTCLDDRRLVDVLFGDAAPEDQAHAQACDACATRLHALAGDVGRIDTVLRTTAPPRAARRRAVAWSLAPVAVAAVLALAVALHRPTPTATTAEQPDVYALADELGAALASGSSLDEDEAADALTTSSTCAWGDPLLGVGCEQNAVLQVAWR